MVRGDIRLVKCCLLTAARLGIPVLHLYRSERRTQQSRSRKDHRQGLD